MTLDHHQALAGAPVEITNNAEPTIHRYDVTFQAAEIGEGHSIITLALSRDGQMSDQNTVFFFETAEQMTPHASKLLAEFLNKYIARLGLVLAEADEPEVP